MPDMKIHIRTSHQSPVKHRMTGAGCHELFAESSSLPAAYGELFLFRHRRKSMPLKTSKQDARRSDEECVFISACKYCVFNERCQFFRHVDSLYLAQLAQLLAGLQAGSELPLPTVLLSVITLCPVHRSCHRAQSQFRSILKVFLKASFPGILQKFD